MYVSVFMLHRQFWFLLFYPFVFDVFSFYSFYGFTNTIRIFAFVILD